MQALLVWEYKSKQHESTAIMCVGLSTDPTYIPNIQKPLLRRPTDRILQTLLLNKTVIVENHKKIKSCKKNIAYLISWLNNGSFDAKMVF